MFTLIRYSSLGNPVQAGLSSMKWKKPKRISASYILIPEAID